MPAQIDYNCGACLRAGLLSAWSLVRCPTVHCLRRSPDSWPPGPGTARRGIVHQDKNLCLAWSERRREARDLWCKWTREKPRGWGMWGGGLFCKSCVQCVGDERPHYPRARTAYSYHLGLQETKGPISPTLLFLQGLAVVSEPKHAMVHFVTWQANAGRHLGCQGNVFHSVSWKFLECQQKPVLSANWIYMFPS